MVLAGGSTLLSDSHLRARLGYVRKVPCSLVQSSADAHLGSGSIPDFFSTRSTELLTSRYLHRVHSNALHSLPYRDQRVFFFKQAGQSFYHDCFPLPELRWMHLVLCRNLSNR